MIEPTRKQINYVRLLRGCSRAHAAFLLRSGEVDLEAGWESRLAELQRLANEPPLPPEPDESYR